MVPQEQIALSDGLSAEGAAGAGGEAANYLRLEGKRVVVVSDAEGVGAVEALAMRARSAQFVSRSPERATADDRRTTCSCACAGEARRSAKLTPATAFCGVRAAAGSL